MTSAGWGSGEGCGNAGLKSPNYMHKKLLVAAIVWVQLLTVGAHAQNTISSFTGDEDFASTAVLSGSSTKLLESNPNSDYEAGAALSEPPFWFLLGSPKLMLGVTAAAMAGLCVCGLFLVRRWKERKTDPVTTAWQY